MKKPTLVPRAMGRRTDEAGEAKTCPGSVRDGMWVVMALDWANVTVIFSQPSYGSLPCGLHSLSSLSLAADGVVWPIHVLLARLIGLSALPKHTKSPSSFNSARFCTLRRLEREVK